MSIAKICRYGFVLLLAIGSVSTACADSAVERQAQLTAAYIFNFMKFVEWPAQVPGDELKVCFVGAHNVRDALANATADKRIGTRRIEVRPIVGEESAVRCEVIYVGERPSTAQYTFHGSATLTIGEEPSFIQEGGIIHLYAESNRLRFAINVANARRAGLTISSNLLKLATRVEQGSRQ